MDEMRVSATDFRVHLKDLGNQVARGGAAIIVSRHGLELGAFVNRDEYAEFREWKRKEREARGEAAVSEPMEAPSEHPDSMPVEEVERVYRATSSATDDWTLQWRRWASQSLQARRRRYPQGPPS